MERQPGNPIEIDVGGGSAAALIRKAREFPERKFIILEPTENKVTDKPENLYFIQWRSEQDNFIPLAENSVSDANVDFLMGEIKWRNHSNADSDEETFNKYRKLLSDIKFSLQDDGILHITDVQFCIKYIIELLQEEGFEIIGGPVRVADEQKTPWTKVFADAFHKSGKSEEGSDALPMELDAVKKVRPNI